MIASRIASESPATAPTVSGTPRTLVQEELGDARLTAEILGHAGLGTVSGFTKITAARRQAAKERIEMRGDSRPQFSKKPAGSPPSLGATKPSSPLRRVGSNSPKTFLFPPLKLPFLKIRVFHETGLVHLCKVLVTQPNRLTVWAANRMAAVHWTGHRPATTQMAGYDQPDTPYPCVTLGLADLRMIRLSSITTPPTARLRFQLPPFVKPSSFRSVPGGWGHEPSIRSDGHDLLRRGSATLVIQRS